MDDSWRELFKGFDPNPQQSNEPASIGESGEISGGREDMPLDTSEGFRYPEEVVSDLTYNSYAFNRSESPEVSVADWTAIFGPTTHAMEQRYQSEFDEWQK